ncbi:plasmid pRiA4b ORF-3 family protein [Companilactobacillus huachuanensis]|uniref:Plasmid pRiA4b ORF-3 family protein n=1 Tax=Companilactobacillus huachuanensis TaxID=2559914 RepID=A0ABW1RML3_9LACO|nr:plasmid pRiA4b ORF-3 family protein [Companilactobacillus huachuanensis]
MNKQSPVAMEITVKLLDTKPATWRKLIVPIGIRYDQLHVLIQLSFGWQNAHLFSFKPKNKDIEYLNYIDDYGDFFNIKQVYADQGYLYQDLSDDTVLYTYDFGEDWEHLITLKKLLTFEDLDNAIIPSCIAGAGGSLGEDGNAPDAATSRFNRKNINKNLSLWSKAGEQMITGADMGLFPNM